MKDRFKILDHPADLGVEASGKTLTEAFENAAAGLMSVILDPATVELRETRQIELASVDFEQLLVKWLAEVLYFYDGLHFVPREFNITKLTRTGLSASIRGEQFSETRHRTRIDVKAITYHQIVVR